MSFFNNKVIIITGASSGIGHACSVFFSNQGARIVLAARNEAKLKEISAGLKGESHYVVCDVSKEEDCKKLIHQSIEKYNQIDILINNAGISMRALFKDVDLSVLKQLMDINFWGTVYCTKYALSHILKSQGSIIAISSIAGYRGLPARTGYSASKHAMQGFMETLRTEHLKDPIQFLTVCPGFTASNIRNTALNQEGKMQGESPRDESDMMTAEEVAIHIGKAIIQKKKTIVLTSQGKLTVFMNKLFNSWMDKMVYNHMAKEKDSPLK
jgi:short-subunit dehydrogenase